MVIISTTPTLEGRPIRDYLGIVTGEVIVGANIFKDLFAGIRDIVGGRAGAYEGALRDARRTAFDELRYEAERLGADAVVGGRYRLRGGRPGRLDADGVGVGHGGEAVATTI